MNQLPLAQQLARAKWAFTTRRVQRHLTVNASHEFDTARAGDLVLAEVVALGQHTGIQLAQGRRAELYPGDLVVIALGARYAPDQFEAVAEIRGEQLDLVAAGGLGGHVVAAHARMDVPTRLRPVALLADAGGVTINLDRFRLDPPRAAARPPVIAVLGTSMNAGKTTAAAAIMHGLAAAGLRVGAAKVTGTGAFADLQAFADAGAAEVIDFTDFGHGSTYLVEPAAVERVMDAALDALAGHDVIVIEIADGLFQRETATLVASPSFAAAVDGVLFAAPDALSAVHGERLLTGRGLPVLAVSGCVTMSPLASLEASAVVECPVLPRASLCSADTALRLFAAAQAQRQQQPRVRLASAA
jgi:hypothetical protein